MIFGKYVNQYYRKYWYYFLLVLIVDALVDIGQLLLPLLRGNAVSALNNKAALPIEGVKTWDRFFTGYTSQFTIKATEDLPLYKTDLFILVRIIFTLGVLIFLGRRGWRLLLGRIGANIERDLRKERFAHIQTRSLSYYSDKKVGGLLSYFTNDVQTIVICFTDGVLDTVDLFALGAVSRARMRRRSYQITLYTALPLVLFVIFGGIVGKGEAKRFKMSSDAFEDLSDFTEENLQGFSVIKAFRKEKDKQKSFRMLSKKAEDSSIRYLRFSSLISASVNVLLAFTFGILYLRCAYSILDNDASFAGKITDVGKRRTFTGYYESLIWPRRAGGILIDYASKGRGAKKRIGTILSSKGEIQDQNNPKRETLKGKVVFSHLSFSYPDGKDKVLSDISFQVNPGEIIGILGRTGSGKSTLVSLLPKLYPLERGRLRIDDVDINDWQKEDLRKSIGFVPQLGYLFSGTIKENIAFSEKDKKKINFNKVEECAQLACVDKDILSFPSGYDTVVGEKGSTLSGGQRQRTCLARAFYKDPSRLVLDDSLSAVDADTEKEILEHLRNREKKVTTFIIAHRVSTLENADKILVLDEGKIVGRGKHQELYETCSLYHDIVERQKLQKERD